MELHQARIVGGGKRQKKKKKKKKGGGATDKKTKDTSKQRLIADYNREKKRGRDEARHEASRS